MAYFEMLYEINPSATNAFSQLFAARTLPGESEEEVEGLQKEFTSWMNTYS
tara:strand:+ start:128 stop:280 length:153 start_codon:yes stop_codon:yes gene_type:complete